MSNPKLFNRYSVPLPAKLVRLINHHQKLLLYAIIGGGAVVIDVGLFWLIDTSTEINPVINNAVSIFAAMVYSFTLNAYFNFRATSGLLKRFISFCLVTTCGFAISSAMLWFMSDVLHINAVIVKTLTLPVVFIVQFSLNSKFTFKQGKEEDIILESIK